MREGESTQQQYKPDNHHRLAGIMSREQKQSACLGLQPFEEVNLLQLMSLQAEIVELQYRFEASCQEDVKANRMHSRSFHVLRNFQRQYRQL
jgi:hypothetical protein